MGHPVSGQDGIAPVSGAELVRGGGPRLARLRPRPGIANLCETAQTPARTHPVMQGRHPRPVAGAGSHAVGLRALEAPHASRRMRRVQPLRAAASLSARSDAALSFVAAAIEAVPPGTCANPA